MRKIFLKLLDLLNLSPGETVVLSADPKNGITIQKKPNPAKKYIGILQGKVNLTTKEYLKIRKEEARL